MSVLPLQSGIVYGPIRSRRLGSSLGLNLSPPDTKLCNFDCAYCQYGWTPAPSESGRRATRGFPSVDAVLAATADALEGARHDRRRLDRITIAGHGEPTLHPRFPQIVNGLRRLRDRLAPAVPLVVLSNSTTAHRPKISAALQQLDERHMKLDAGGQALLRLLNGSRAPLERIVAALAALPNVTIQTMFVADPMGRLDNTGEAAVTAWIAALVEIQPLVVEIYTIDRAPASPRLERAPAWRLQEIAARARGAGLAVELF